MKQKHHIRYDKTPDMLSAPKAPQAVATYTVRIEFDGGTPCNIPSIGYGDGYGSYKINSDPIRRLNFLVPMSANVAEITTLRQAVEEVAARFTREQTALTIFGDSQIALKWARGATESGRPVKKAKHGSPEFLDAVRLLREAVNGFVKVEATWRGREESVRVFGH